MDTLSVVQVELLGPDHKPLEVPSSDFATGANRPAPDNENLGWLTATLCAGTMTETPNRVNVPVPAGSKGVSRTLSIYLNGNSLTT